MLPRHILQLDAGLASVHLWNRGDLRLEADYPVTAEGAADFAARLAEQPEGHYALLVDVNEEGFQYDTIPFVRGAARKALIKRKLTQAYYGSSLIFAQSLGREAKGRRDERILLMGLTRPEFFTPWLTALRQTKTTLAGVYSTALVATVLAQKTLRESSPRFVLVTQGRAGIRLCYFEEGKLRFSHLGLLPARELGEGEKPEDLMAKASAQEVSRLVTYLHGQRLVPRDFALPCLILAHPAHHAALAAECASSGEIAYNFLDLSAVCRQAGLLNPPVDSCADSLLLHLAASQPPDPQFAPREERHLHQLWRAQGWIMATSAAFLGVCLLVAGMESWLAIAANTDARKLYAESHALGRAYQARLDALPPLATLPENLRTLSGSYRVLDHYSPKLEDSLIFLSQVLEGFPDVTLTKLEWEVGGNPDGAETPARPAGGGGMFLITTFSATLPAGMGLRQQLDIGDALSAALSKDNSFRVVFVKRPVSMEPGKLIKSLENSLDKSAPPELTLRLMRRL